MTPGTRRAAAVALITGPVAYLAAEALAAAAWTTPPHSYVTNWISDLGSTVAGQFQGRLIDSPLHAVMNTGFVLQGIAFTAATLLLARSFTHQLAWTTRILGIAVGIGFALLGLFHGSQAAADDGTLALHFTGAALSPLGANTLAVILGTHWARHHPAGLGWASITLGAIGLAAIVVLFATFGSPAPVGLIERASAYPVMLWQLLMAAYLLRTTDTGR